MNYKKLFIFFIIGTIIIIFKFNLYSYFFSKDKPSINLKNIENEKYFSKNINFDIDLMDKYSIKSLSIYLDNKEIIKNLLINNKKFSYNFNLATDNIENGKHKLIIEVENNTIKNTKNKLELFINIDKNPLNIEIIKEAPKEILQGKTIHFQIKSNKLIDCSKVSMFGKNFELIFSEDLINNIIYDCYIPVDCCTIPNKYNLEIFIKDKVNNNYSYSQEIKVVKANFKKQIIKVDSQKLKSENSKFLSEKEFELDIEKLSQNSIKNKLFKGQFCLPLETDINSITSNYGVIRTSQERGLYQHKAIDISSMPKNVVWAPQDGIIVLKNRYCHSGNTIVIDHGYGILSLFFHLDSFANVEISEKIKKGNPIGTVGKTGYATGYHLHWELRINNIAVDPLQWVKEDF